MSPPTRECQRCGSPLPEAAPGGECPVCLLQLTLDQLATPPGIDSSPKTVAELAEDFPDLEIEVVIGRGGAGVVYKARHVRLNRPVALKLLVPERAADPVFAERFVREAQTLARLSHPSIVGVHDVGRAAGTVYIVMEYVDGCTLRDKLRTGRIAPADALRLIPQLCEALQFAHDRGVVHRDIKPENVLIDRDGRVKIADFGLAKCGEDGELTLTGSGARMGTARYMAPEQWADTAGVDHRADIYSLGVLFYEMLTGDLPTPQCKPPSAKAGTDPRLDRVVSKSLRDEPAERYQQAAEIKTDVERIASTPRWRTPALLVTTLTLVVAAVVLIARPGAGPLERYAPVVQRSELSPTDILTSPEWGWMPPENLGPGVNSAHDDGSPFVSADGLTLLFHSNRPEGHGRQDLWQCRRKSVEEPFADPENLGPTVNTPEDDTDPCMSADGRTLVFVSRRGERNRYDLWMSRRTSADAEWGRAEDLGPAVNAGHFSFRPWLSRDGLTLTFTSGRPPGGIWVSRRGTVDEAFGQPTPYGRDSSQKAIGAAAFSWDGRTILFNRSDRVFPGDLLWLARVDDPADPFRNLISFGPVVNAASVDTNPAAAPDGRTVYFRSDRPGGSGQGDLWLTRRVPKADREK